MSQQQDQVTGVPHHNIHHTPETLARNVNKPAADVPYFTPAQDIPAGTALVDEETQDAVPKLFKPLKIRGMLMRNRIMLSPLCQYSADDGHYTMWHQTHMGGIVQRGPGLVTVEATAVTPNSRISPQDTGLWIDSQINPLKQVVDFAHSQGQKIMIQLAHAGRKASVRAPWLDPGGAATKEEGGWPDDVWAPSPIAWDARHAQPKEMSLEDIEAFKAAWISAVERALKAGFDAIEIHNGHGYLLAEFLSPIANRRTDKYGGSWENRIRLTCEVITRKTIPEDMPLFLRLSATDWLEDIPSIPESWTGEDTTRLAPILTDLGVDLLDITSGGNHPLQRPHVKPGYQAPFAIQAKKVVGDKMAVGVVGMIESAQLANELLEKEGLDVVAVGRGSLKNPGLVLAWGNELGVSVQMPHQIQ